MISLKHLMNSMNLLNSTRVIHKTNNLPALYLSSKSITELTGGLQAPKRPLTPYFRFLKQTRPKILSENPNLSNIEVVKEMAKRWEVADGGLKSSLETEYKKEHEVYVKQLIEYKSKLTPDMIENIKLARQEKMENKEKRLIRKKNRELGKPKRAPSSFLRYVLEQKAKQEPIANYTQFIKKVSEQWSKLSDAEKKPYQDAFHKETAQYKEKLEKWETKMLKEGHLEVVRNPLLLDTPAKSTKVSERPASRPRKNPQQQELGCPHPEPNNNKNYHLDNQKSPSNLDGDTSETKPVTITEVPPNTNINNSSHENKVPPVQEDTPKTDSSQPINTSPNEKIDTKKKGLFSNLISGFFKR